MIRRAVVSVVVLVGLVYAGMAAYLFVNQRGYFFFPEGRIWELTEVGLDAELVRIDTADGQTIAGWYAPPTGDRPTILYLKGNTGSFTAEHERFATFTGDGYGFLAVDYRGFPLSPGEISETNILADALAAFDWLSEREDTIVLWGRSLGSSPAVYVASRREVQAVLLETPMYSAVSIAAERYPYVPVRLLMHDQFRSNEWIGDVEAPVFIAHGTADIDVSVTNGERLFAEVVNPYELWIAEDADHGAFWGLGIWERAQAFFEAAIES